MAIKDLLLKEKVEHTGVFNFAGLYKFMHDWLTNQEQYGVVEEKYTESVVGNSKNITVEWVATKKMGDYFKIEIKFEIKGNGLVDVEVETDGVKKKMQKGNVAIEIKGAIIKDPKSKWEGKPFDMFLRGWYDKFVVPQQIDTVEDKIRGDVKSLKDEIKSYLELIARR